MKNPNTGKTFLDISDINRIMPEGMQLYEERVSRGVYQAENGYLVSISNSKCYEKGNIAWYYAYIDRYANAGVNYMLFTVGLIGIVLVPMSVMEKYKKSCSWKDGRFPKEKRYRIDIKKDRDGEFFFINTSEVYTKRFPLKKYYIPFCK